MEQILEPTNDLAWILESEGYDQLRQSSLDSRFAISNGFLGVKGGRVTTRGARSIPPSRIYVAGLFDMAGIDHAVPGLVPAADWLQVRILLAGAPIVHHPGDLSSHRMTLDMRRGALLSHGHHSNSPDIIARVRSLRVVSLSERAVGLQLIQFEIEAGTVEITLEASFEGMGLGLVSERTELDLWVWRTHDSGKRLAMASASSLQIDGDDPAPKRGRNSALRDAPAGAPWSLRMRQPGRAAGRAATLR